MLLNEIAVIVAGIALLVEDRNIRARQAGLMSYTGGYTPEAAADSGGVSAGTLAGITGIVLGILAILGIVAVVLTAVALIVFGAAVLFDFAAGAQAMVVRPMYREGVEQSVR